MKLSTQTERDNAHRDAHCGVLNEMRVSVPNLDNCLEGICGGNADFLDSLGDMKSDFSLDDRETLLDQLVLAVRSFYVHQPMKWAKHAVDPVKALLALRRRCKSIQSDLHFHTAVARIFKSLRDIHTAYILPEPYRSSVWFLPFTLGVYWEGDCPRVLVDRVISGFPEAGFKRGAEILTWNGRDIENAIRAVGHEESGSNRDAQFALGLRMMTIRWLGGSVVPDSHWVTLGYLQDTGPEEENVPRTYREIRMSWRKLLLHHVQDGASGWEIPLQAALVLDKDIEGAARQGRTRRNRKHNAVCADRHGLILQGITEKLFPQPNTPVRSIVSKMPEIFTAEHRVFEEDDKSIPYGYLRIAHFMASEDEFVLEFKRLLLCLPRDRLIIDLRSNAGGNPFCAERVMHLLTDQRIDPLPFEFLATPEAEAWLHGPNALSDPDFCRWGTLVKDSVTNGFMFSPSRSLADPEKANGGARRYFGGVALLVNAITYSTGDLFAAMFHDHKIGPIVGEAHATGGGGADMMDHHEIVDRAPRGLGYCHLPHGARMHLAIRRFLRVGAVAGLPVEEVGVKVDLFHPPSEVDFYGFDQSLIREALMALDNWKPSGVAAAKHRSKGYD